MSQINQEIKEDFLIVNCYCHVLWDNLYYDKYHILKGL